MPWNLNFVKFGPFRIWDDNKPIPMSRQTPSGPLQFLPPHRLRPFVPLWAFGLEGPWLGRHLAESLDKLSSDQPELAGVRNALAAWRFERFPLDPACVRSALSADRTALGSGLRALALKLSPRLSPPLTARDWPALRDAGDRQAALAVLTAGMADPDHALYWQGKALEYALTAGLPDLAEAAIRPLAADPATAPLVPRLAAEIAATFGDAACALNAAQAVDATLFPRFAALATGSGLAAAGERAAGIRVFSRLWRQENWHPGLTLTLHALRHPTPEIAPAASPGRVSVCVYSWNRADRLARTLQSLAESDLGPARVFVLDNGSTDDTAAVCRACAPRFGAQGLALVSLPVNIGAPAARNWLATRSPCGPDDRIAYVDDDVLVPKNWLSGLLGALAADPEADVAGARILAGDTRVPVSADVHLLAPEGASTVRPLVNCPRGPDFGLTAANRPCPSVSGCCHLFRGRALAGPAPFDIRFSPSQFDDLARDIGAYLAGGRCVLAGNIAVAHHQPQPAGNARARSLGARRKLDGLFSDTAMTVAAKRDLDTAWEELETKWAELARLSRAGIDAD